MGGSRPEESRKDATWRVYVDGVSNCQGARVGIILISSKGIRMEKPFKLGFQASNNEAKYEALLMGLQMSNEVRARRLQLHCDFRLVVN